MNNHPIDFHVGNRIRNRRRLIDMSAMQLAAGLGVTYQQVIKYECGHNRISASMLYKAAIVLDVAPGYFFEGLDPDDAHTVKPKPRTSPGAAAVC